MNKALGRGTFVFNFKFEEDLPPLDSLKKIAKINSTLSTIKLMHEWWMYFHTCVEPKAKNLANL